MSSTILPRGYQLLVKQMDVDRIKSGSQKFDDDAFKVRFKPTDISFVPPDWTKMFSKATPSMSEEEYEKAITEQATKDAQDGIRRMTSQGSADLYLSFIQGVSPDRKGIYDESMSKTGGKMNQAHAFFTDTGKRVMHYNTKENSWMNIMTNDETARRRQFTDIYNKAYMAAYNTPSNAQTDKAVAPNSNDGAKTLTPIASYYTKHGLTPPVSAKESALFSTKA